MVVTSSCQDLLDDMGLFDAGQAEIKAGVAIGKFPMVETHEVQHRRMDVVDMDAVFDGTVAEFVSRSIRETPFDAAAREPHRKAVMVVITTSRVASTDGDLDGGSATEFTAADHKRLVEQSAPSEIGEQRGDRAVAFVAELAMFDGEVIV